MYDSSKYQEKTKKAAAVAQFEAEIWEVSMRQAQSKRCQYDSL